MFDIGFLELMLIGIVGLVVIGPERLPAVARTLGKWIGRTRRFISNVKQDIDRELRDEELRQALARDANLDEIKNIINDTRFTIEDEVKEAQDYVVKARDDDPGRDSQENMLREQDDGFDDEDYGITDHTDLGALEEAEKTEQAVEQESALQAETKTEHIAKDDGQDNKANG